MHRSVRRVSIGSLVMVALLVATAGRAEAATITVGLAIVSSQDAEIQVSPGVVVTTSRTTWGNVRVNGQTVGTYVMRSEFGMPNSEDTNTAFPLPQVTLTLRLNASVGTQFDTLIMQGTVPGPGPNPEQITIFGGVVVGTGSLAFLKNATWTTSVGVGDIPLTFTY
jgi:hypothetical protein